MEQPYNHAEINSNGYYVWSDERLVQRFIDLEETKKIPHSPERALKINHEMAYIAFELVMREIDEQKTEHEIAQLEAMYASERVEDDETDS